MGFPLGGAIAVLLYVALLFALSSYRARGADLGDYLLGGKNSTWWLLTIGMISDSVSGVTYVSVPGGVATLAAPNYAYLQIIFGHFFGYQIIAFGLLPLYYRRDQVSIYSYLRERFGAYSEKTGASFFVGSRLFGSAARLFIATTVLHTYFFGNFAISPIFTYFGALALIVLYTYRGGIKSLVWTDAFQSIFLMLGIGSVFFVLARGLPDAWGTLSSGKIFYWDVLPKNYFWKHFIGGIFITVAMNGLDQNIMQKNLSCARLRDAQKNMILFGFVLVAVNFVFVGLGALVIETWRNLHVTIPLTANGAFAADRLLPELIFTYFPGWPSLFLILGLTAATLSSVDSVLPTLASAIEMDLLSERLRKRIPIRALHLAVAIALFLLMLGLHAAKTQSLIDVVLRYIGYTSGPLLGMYGVGLLTRIKLVDGRVPFCALGAVALTATIDHFSAAWLAGYQIGYELILINGLFFALISLLLARAPQKP